MPSSRLLFAGERSVRTSIYLLRFLINSCSLGAQQLGLGTWDNRNGEAYHDRCIGVFAKQPQHVMLAWCVRACVRVCTSVCVDRQGARKREEAKVRDRSNRQTKG